MTDEELVAWVDDNEQFIKAIPISLANSDQKYLHIEVAILLFDKQKRVLLQKRASTKKVMPGVWICSVAGHITYGETVETAAHRELVEEIGFDVQLTEVTAILNTLPKERHIAHWFLGEYQDQDIVVDPSETDDHIWLGKKDLQKFITKNNVAPITIQIAKRFWSGEWDDLLS